MGFRSVWALSSWGLVQMGFSSVYFSWSLIQLGFSSVWAEFRWGLVQFGLSSAGT